MQNSSYFTHNPIIVQFKKFNLPFNHQARWKVNAILLDNGYFTHPEVAFVSEYPLTNIHRKHENNLMQLL